MALTTRRPSNALVAREARRSRKPLVGAGSILVALAGASILYRVLGDPLAAAVFAGLATLVAPAYYAYRLMPWKSYAASVLASMLSGSLAWLGVRIAGGSPGVYFDGLDYVLLFVAGIASLGVASHAAAAVAWMSIISSVYYEGLLPYPHLYGFLALTSATTLGSFMVRTFRRPYTLLSPATVFIAGAGVVLLLACQFMG